MTSCRVLALAIALLPCLKADTAASIAAELKNMSLDPQQTYRVRDLQLVRGDIKIYLTEGLLSFANPIAGHTIAAVFTTAHSEGGDGEILLLPPTPSERASLASFAKTPNLDQHFLSAVFFFSDETGKELLRQIQDHSSHSAPEEGSGLAVVVNPVLRIDSSEIDIRLVQGLLDAHKSSNGFFYGVIGTNDVGTLNVLYEPTRFEPVSVGRVAAPDENGQDFQVWTSFRPRRASPYLDPISGIKNYKIDTTVHSDLSLASTAKFEYTAVPEDGRVIALDLAARLHVASAKVDDRPAEVFEHPRPAGDKAKGVAAFLIVANSPLTVGSKHNVEVSYQGSVISQTRSGGYFVDDRNAWFPFITPTLATFDLTFHCPDHLRLVSTGELISDETADGIRTVHRKSEVAEPLAGFNLGDYSVSVERHGPYRIELYSTNLGNGDLPTQTASVLDYFTNRWITLPNHSLAVSPIDGYFGQGFPGLIYLSSISYLREDQRPIALRNPELDSFFSEMLLPHEIAHQWWGNIVNQADYRTAWLLEAMSNYSALEYLEEKKGHAAMDSVLNFYRRELTVPQKDKPGESAGPVDFGQRLLDNSGMQAWHLILYEKGAWILHMLRRRLGDEVSHQLQLRMLHEYASKPINNEDFRKLAQQFVPSDQADPTLSLFFEDWVYGTGIPKLALKQGVLTVSEVDDSYSADIPLRCSDQIHWIRASAGENTFEPPKGSSSCSLPRETDYLYSSK